MKTQTKCPECEQYNIRHYDLNHYVTRVALFALIPIPFLIVFNDPQTPGYFFMSIFFLAVPFFIMAIVNAIRWRKNGTNKAKCKNCKYEFEI